MKKLFILFTTCLIAASMLAQQPHGRHHHHQQQPPKVERHHQPAPPMPCATREQMQMVMQTIKAQPFDDKKLEIARLCVTIGRFCTDDLAMMATEFAFDDSRLLFLQYAYPYCTDPERYPLLQECFTFRSNYDKLIQTIYRR